MLLTQDMRCRMRTRMRRLMMMMQDVGLAQTQTHARDPGQSSVEKLLGRKLHLYGSES